MQLRRLCLLTFLITATCGAWAETAPATAPAAPAANGIVSPEAAFAADRGRISYAVGIEMARNFRKNEVDVDLDQVIQGMRDGLAGQQPPMGEKELRKILNNFQNTMRARTMASQHVLATANRRKGEKFLAEHRTAPNVRVLTNGVQILELAPGSGPRPTLADVVSLKWRGTTLDGDEFDSSDPRQPMSMPVADLFPGFQAALAQMPQGAHWQVWVPPALAYGERGAGTVIGPNETLMLDLELVAVQQRAALAK